MWLMHSGMSGVATVAWGGWHGAGGVGWAMSTYAPMVAWHGGRARWCGGMGDRVAWGSGMGRGGVGRRWHGAAAWGGEGAVAWAAANVKSKPGNVAVQRGA